MNAKVNRFFLRWKRVSVLVAMCGVLLSAFAKFHILFMVYGAMLAGLGIGSGCASDFLLLHLYDHDTETIEASKGKA